MTFFMEVEPPVATLPLRVPAACPAAEEAVAEAEAAVPDAEEAEPPQAVRAAAAAAAPQTVRNERREIFFMIEFPPLKTRAPARHCLFVFSLGTALFYRFAALAATMDVQKVRKTLCILPAPM
jgi:hypothetical protein